MEDNFSKFKLTTGADYAGASLPVIAMPEKKIALTPAAILNNSRILGAALLMAILLFIAVLAVSVYKNKQATLQAGLTAQLQIQHLRLATDVQQVLSGNMTSLAQLQNNQSRLNHYITLLSQGGTYRNEQIAPISESFLSLNLDTYAKSWQQEEKRVYLLLNQKESLVEFHQLIKDINGTQHQLNRFIEELMRRMAESGNLSQEMRSVELIKTHARNIARGVNTFFISEFPITEISQQLMQEQIQISAHLQAIVHGNNGLMRMAGRDEATQDLLSHIQLLIRKLDDYVNLIPREVSLIATVKLTGHEIVRQSEMLLGVAQELEYEIQEFHTKTVSWMHALIYTSSAVLLVMLVLLGRAIRRSSYHQALASRNEMYKAQKAIQTLLADMRKIADGDLTIRTNAANPVTGAIADAVNSTTEELHTLVEQVNQASALVVKASNQAQKVSDDLLTAAQQQSARIAETSMAILGVSESITQISDAATESARVAQQSLTTAEKGTRAVRESITGMNEIRMHIQDTSKRIKRLGESSQEVGEIVALITDITDQTNVLAVNAALQASAAGEAGHGFRNIAQEIQRLAERSTEASQQISELILTIQGDTQDAIAAMERSTLGVAKGTKRSDAAGQALEEIETVSKQLEQLVSNIFTITSTQTEAANQVVANLEEILHITKQTTQGTQQTTTSIKQITGFATELKASVSSFRV